MVVRLIRNGNVAYADGKSIDGKVNLLRKFVPTVEVGNVLLVLKTFPKMSARTLDENAVIIATAPGLRTNVVGVEKSLDQRMNIAMKIKRKKNKTDRIRAELKSCLRPCPFCGQDPDVHFIGFSEKKRRYDHSLNPSRVWVKCCVVYIPHVHIDNYNELVEKWNGERKVRRR